MKVWESTAGLRPLPVSNRIERTSVTTAETSFPYQPALDGLRGAAVALVVLFHAGFDWMPGGYVGVSVFFTLSGYLITSLAITEHEQRGELDVRAFYARRIRRLMPASLVCVVGVIVAAMGDNFLGITRLRRDLWAALLQVYNWAFLASGDSYGEQIARAAGQRAPLDHYWSLAIEEQFYLIWPLVLVVVFRLAGRTRLAAVGLLTATFAAIAVGISLVFGDDAAYFATPARLPEILIGAVAAFGLHQRDASSILRRVGADWIGVMGLLVILWAALSWPEGHGPAYDGWLPALAVASVALIVGLQVESPLRSIMSVPPLVFVGRISYGVYLYHWPIFTIVDERRFDIGQTELFALRAVLVVAAASVSYYVVERPIRRVRRHTWQTFGVAASLCAAVAAVVVVVPDRNGLFTFVAPETARLAGIPLPSAGQTPAAIVASGRVGDPRLPEVVSRPARVLVIGDSTAFVTGQGLIEWAASHRDLVRVTSKAIIGCGLSDSGTVPHHTQDEACADHRDTIPDFVDLVRPDVVLAMVTIRDAQDRVWDDDEGLLPITDERHFDRLVSAYETLTRRLLESGAREVIWVIPPVPRPLPNVPETWILDNSYYEQYRRVIEALPTRFEEGVVVIDMDRWLADTDDPPDRYDGIHWSIDAAYEVADQFLVAAIFDLLLGGAEPSS